MPLAGVILSATALPFQNLVNRVTDIVVKAALSGLMTIFNTGVDLLNSISSEVDGIKSNLPSLGETVASAIANIPSEDLESVLTTVLKAVQSLTADLELVISSVQFDFPVILNGAITTLVTTVDDITETLITPVNNITAQTDQNAILAVTKLGSSVIPKLNTGATDIVSAVAALVAAIDKQ